MPEEKGVKKEMWSVEKELGQIYITNRRTTETLQRIISEVKKKIKICKKEELNVEERYYKVGIR